MWVKDPNAKKILALSWSKLTAKSQSDFIKRTVDNLVAEAVANHKVRQAGTKDTEKTESLIKVCLQDFIEEGKAATGKKFGDKGGIGELLETIVFSRENDPIRLQASKMDKMMELLAEESDEAADDSAEEKELNRKLSLEIRSAYVVEWASKLCRKLINDANEASPKN